MSRTNCVIPFAKASTLPLVLGTIAMLLAIDPSEAFKVETGCWFVRRATVSGSPGCPSARPSH